jgi:hypothetical protein
MIKTLRITSIIAAIAATVLLILPAVYGVRSDPKIEEFIKSPGTVDKFTAAKGQNPAQKNTESPLVKEAVVYKNIINPLPPPPPKAPPVGTPQGPVVPTPPVVAVKFDLVATSYYASHPEQSFILINEPGKGLYWVKQGSAVGHLTIETVKDGAVIVRDGQRTSEMTVKVQESWRKLLKNPPASTSPSSSSAAPASPAAQAPTSRPGPENPVQPSAVTTDKPGLSNPDRTGTTPLPRRINPRAGIIPPASERITSAAQPTPAIGQLRPAEPVKTPPAAQITPPPQEIPISEESPAIKEKDAKLDKLVSEVVASEGVTPEEQKKLDEVFKQMEELGKIREAEEANDVNAKDVNK